MATKAKRPTRSGKVGKTKQWRTTKKQINPADGKLTRYGRAFRNAMARIQTTKAFPTAIILTLMKNGGIATPIFDKAVLSMQNTQDEVKNDDIQDVEVLSESLQVSAPV